MKAALAVLLVCSAIASAHAQEVIVAPPANDAASKIRAQALLSEGTAAYGRGDYAAALEKFTAAYQIFPSPKLWFNIGQANRDLGRPVEAVAAFDRFLREAGDAPPETLAEARRSAAELKTRLGQIQIICPTDGAEVTVDGKQVGSTPLGEMVWTTPGRHQVAVQREGFSPAIQDVVVTTGKVASVDFELRPIDLRAANPDELGAGNVAANVAPVVPEDDPVYRHTWFWIAVGIAVAVGVGVGVVLATRDSGSAPTTLGAQKAF